MSKTLQEERDGWESSDCKTLVTHFEMKHRAACVSILVEGLSGANGETHLYYDMIRYFKIGNDWVTSCDVRSGSAHDIMRKIGEII
jgi:hypothetical protein